MKTSLHRRLVWILLGLTFFTWLVTATLLYFSPGRALEQLIDRQLRQYSHVVTYIARVFAQQIDEGLPLYDAWREFNLQELRKRPLVVEGLEDPGPSPAVNIRRVTQRLYRGYCEHNDAIPAVVEEFLARQADVFALVDSFSDIPGLERARVSKYLLKFFEMIDPPKTLNSKVTRRCR